MSMYNFQTRASYDFCSRRIPVGSLAWPVHVPYGCPYKSAGKFQVRPGICNLYLHSPGPVRSRRTDRAGMPKPLWHQRKPLRCPHDWMYRCFQGHTIHRGPYVARTQTLRKLEVVSTDVCDAMVKEHAENL